MNNYTNNYMFYKIVAQYLKIFVYREKFLVHFCYNFCPFL